MKKPMMFFQGFGGGGGGGGSVPYMQIAGGLSELAFGLAGGFGDKPQVAPWRTIPYESQIVGSAQDFLTGLPEITGAEDAYRNLILSQQEQLLPGFTANLAAGERGVGQLLGTGEQWLSGDPGAVLSNAIGRYVGQGGAESVLGSGNIGALGNIKGNLNYNTMLDLMTRGSQMIGQGGSSAQQWASLAGQDILNPSFFMVSPQQRMENSMQQALIKRNIQQQIFNRNAAPDPTMLGLMSIASQFTGGGNPWQSQQPQSQSSFGGYPQPSLAGMDPNTGQPVYNAMAVPYNA